MTAYVLRGGRLVPKHLAGPPVPRGPRSHLPAPQIIQDGCEVRSQADGRIYTSKAAYRRALKDRGLVEVGTDASWRHAAPDPLAGLPPVEADVARAFDELASR